MTSTRRRTLTYRVLLGLALLLACVFGSAGGYQLAFLLHPELSRSVIGYQEYTLAALLLLVLPCVILASLWLRAGPPLLSVLSGASFIQALLVTKLAAEGFGAGTLAFLLAEGVYMLLAGVLFRWRSDWDT